MADPLTTELENAVEKGLAQGQQQHLGSGAQRMTGSNRASNNGFSAALGAPPATMGDVIQALEHRNIQAKSDLDTLIAGLQRLREEL